MSVLTFVSPIPMPPWVEAIASLSPFILGVLGILIGRKSKTATDAIKIDEIVGRISTLEKVQAEHVITIAKLGQNIVHINRQLARIEDDSSTSATGIAEVRGMLYAMQGVASPPPLQKQRRLPAVDEGVLA